MEPDTNNKSNNKPMLDRRVPTGGHFPKCRIVGLFVPTVFLPLSLVSHSPFASMSGTMVK